MLRRPQRGVLHHAKDEGEVSEADAAKLMEEVTRPRLISLDLA